MERKKVEKDAAVKFKLLFTTSKVAAYIILMIGTTYSFMFKDGSILLATFSAVSAILMMKTYTNSKIEIKKGGNDENII